MRFLSLLLICCLYQFALAQTGGNNYALFFANDDYRTTPGFNDLKNPVRDALAIEKELKEMYSFKTELYKNFDRKAILSTLQQWQNKRFAKNDQLFIFFSGHGTFEDISSTGYFVPKTTSNDYSTFMDLTKLSRIITKIGCQHILLAIDACYSGTIVEEIALKGFEVKRPQENQNTKRNIFINLQLRNKSRLVLTSGGKERTPDGDRHSPFANAILTKLRSTYTDRGDGVCTYQDLISQMERVAPTPRQGRLSEDEQGSFVFAVKEWSSPLYSTYSPPWTKARSSLDLDNMVFVKGGTFQMGSKDGGSNETPHTVTLSDYYMGRYEVTFAEYDAFCAATGKDKPDDEGWGRKKCPVINANWYDAIEYCNWLSQKEGYQKVYTIKGTTVTANWNANGYRLPTEAEWEYAARSRGKDQKWAGTSTESQLTSFANGGGKTDGYEYTSPVGTFKANDLGLFDMSGNVWEWCWDWYRSDYYTKSTGTAPKGPNTGSSRVLRGGSWFYFPVLLRCADRYGYSPDVRGSMVGFRLSRAAR